MVSCIRMGNRRQRILRSGAEGLQVIIVIIQKETVSFSMIFVYNFSIFVALGYFCSLLVTLQS